MVAGSFPFPALSGPSIWNTLAFPPHMELYFPKQSRFSPLIYGVVAETRLFLSIYDVLDKRPAFNR